MKWTVGLSVVLIALAGCATGYNKSGFLTGGGFSDTQLDENVFNITFRGNQYTSMERAKDFIYLRAADLTLKSGFTYFAITYATENVSTSSYTTASETTTQVNFYGNTADATSQTTPGTTFTKSRPSIEMTIICFAEKPNTNATVFNATGDPGGAALSDNPCQRFQAEFFGFRRVMRRIADAPVLMPGAFPGVTVGLP